MVVGILMGLLISVWPVSAAHADPSTTDAKRTAAAAIVAKDMCSTNLPSIPMVEDKVTQLCTDTLVRLVTDPANAGAKAACTAELAIFFLAGNTDAVQACTKMVQPLVAAALSAFGAALQAASDVVDCVAASQTEAFGCQVMLLDHFVASGVQGMWSAAVGVVLAPTAATNIIDLGNNPNLSPQATAFRALYADVGWLATSLVEIFVLVSLIVAVVRQRARTLWESLSGVAAWGIFWVVGMAAAVMILSTTDSVTLFLAGGADGSKMQLLNIGAWLDLIATSGIGKVLGAAATATGTNLGSSVGLLMLVGLFFAFVVILVTLALREVSIILMALVLPILLAMQAGPGGMRKALPNVAKAFITVAIAKPLMVLVLRAGTGWLTVPADGKMNLFAGMCGVVLIGMGAFAPGAAYRLFGFMEGAAGQRFGGGSHSIDQGGRSAVDAADAARTVFSSNAPPALSAPAATSAAPRVAATAAAPKAAASAAGGPLGLIVGAGAMAASTVSSVGSMVASQVATGGGALGDAEHAQPGSFPRSFGPSGLPPAAAQLSAPTVPPTPPVPPTAGQ